MSDGETGESGRRAEAKKIIDSLWEVLTRKISEEHAADGGVPIPKNLSWDDPADRQLVRATFEGDDGLTPAERDEAILPGFGPEGRAETAKDDCGNPHPFVCDCCGHSVEFGRTCGMSICARCAQVWVRDAAIQKSAKLRRVRKEKHQNTPDSEHQKHHHVIISPPPGWFYVLAKAGYSIDEAQEITKKAVKKVLDELRAQGVVARHSFRGARDDGSLKTEDDDRGAWKERLFSGREWYRDVRNQLAWMPHYHAVVVSDFIKGGDLTERVEDETGWVIHRIADDDGVSIPDDGSMARALTYCLSHADIQVREDAPNRSAVWEVGTFEGDIIKSSGRFSPWPGDLEWADGAVRDAASTVLGISSGTTDCGVTLPGVDDPDELARRILEELYPDDEERRRDVPEDVVLHHVAEGRIGVEVETTAGGGGDVTVLDAFGQPVDGGFGGSVPDAPGLGPVDAADEPPVSVVEDGTEHEHGDAGDAGDDEPEECGGTLIPLEEARRRGLLDDDEWRRDAPHVQEAEEADREWSEDLEPWRYSSPGSAAPVAD